MSEQLEEGDDAEAERFQKILRSHVAQLMEHFDSVEVVVTKYDSENERTYKGNRGGGNWYANYGACKEWVQEQEAKLRRHAIREDEESE